MANPKVTKTKYGKRVRISNHLPLETSRKLLALAKIKGVSQAKTIAALIEADYASSHPASS